MSIRNIDALFNAKSLALIGASTRANAVGAVVLENLKKSGFAGEIFPVNPKADTIDGLKAYPSVDALPLVPDIAVLCTPGPAVPDLISQLGAKGTRLAIVITAGFGEGNDEAGKALRQRMLEAARPHQLRIIGPNCLGALVPRLGLNASFSHLTPADGDLAVIAQSGAIVTSVIDWAESHRIGFSGIVSLGDMSDVDFADMLDYLAADNKTRAILLYIEAVTEARKFLSAARAASRQKPVIVVKAGRFDKSAKAAASHTGAMAGSDDVYDAAFRRAGLLRVNDLIELFDAVETLSIARRVHGDRLAIVTNGGGLGVMAADALLESGGALADLTPETVEALSAVLPSTWSHANPVDIIGDAPGERYLGALEALRKDPNVDAVLVLNCPTAIASSEEAASVIAGAAGNLGRRPLFTSWIGDATARKGREIFTEKHIPTYETPRQAVRAFMHMVRYHRGQERLMQTPSSSPDSFQPDRKKVEQIFASALAEGRSWLTTGEAKDVIAAYQIPVVRTATAATPEDAAAMAADIGFPVAIKIHSADIIHKRRAGGVALNLETADAVRTAAARMLETIKHQHPEAKLDGFMIEPMVDLRGAVELILGVADDPTFGAVLLFGHGGPAAERINDKTIGFPPLNQHLADDMIAHTQVSKLLEGPDEGTDPGGPASGSTSIRQLTSEALVKISQLLVDFPRILELDVNPLVAGPERIIALDARIRLSQEERGKERFAIKPYPRELEEKVTLRNGRPAHLRPIHPADEPAVQELFKAMPPEMIRMRFFSSLRHLPHTLAARLTQIDYDREIALVLCEPAAIGKAELYGVGRIVMDANREKAEYSITVLHSMARLGLGEFLMRRLIDHAIACGISEVYGYVLRENAAMLGLAKKLGFKSEFQHDDPHVVRTVLDLTDRLTEHTRAAAED